MKQNHHYTFETKAVLYSGLLTFALLCILFAVGGLAPFGSKSLAVMDADIQYLDFFSYFKDVLSGKNTIGYTFGKTLGGSNIAVFSYYLSSPFNLLLFFFQQPATAHFFRSCGCVEAHTCFCGFCLFQRTPFQPFFR